MNTTNYQPIPGLTWEKVFAAQADIMTRYEPELKEKIFLGDFDINTLEDQELAKKFIGRITEELCETKEAWDTLNNPDTPHSGEFEKQLADHVVEELVDAFNFFLEFHTLTGLPFGQESFSTGLRRQGHPFEWDQAVFWLGMVSNRLKNRGWRSSQYLVDLKPFGTCLSEATRVFGELFAYCGLHRDQEVFEYWSLKYQVNLFRLETKY